MQALRDILRDTYNRYDTLIQLVLKFAVAIFVFVEISNMLGYMELLNQPFILVILALICAILPWNGCVVIAVFLIVLHCFALGLEVGLVAAALFLIMLLFYFRLVSSVAFALMLTPIGFQLGIPAAVPLGLGIFRGSASAVTMIFGVVAAYFVKTVNGPVALMKAAGSSSMLEVVQTLLNDLVQNMEMYLCIIAAVAACLLASAIRKFVAVHAGLLAAAFGGCVYLAVMLLGGLFLQTEPDLMPQLINLVVSVLVVLLLDLLVFSMDYKGSRRLQFEDDDYYYFVKVIPKKKSAVSAAGEERQPEISRGGKAPERRPDTQQGQPVQAAGQKRRPPQEGNIPGDTARFASSAGQTRPVFDRPGGPGRVTGGTQRIPDVGRSYRQQETKQSDFAMNRNMLEEDPE